MEKFEHSGEWWDIRDPATRWTGILRFDPVEGALLSLTDPTPDIPASQALAAAFGRTLKEYDSILGTTTDGKAVTLLRCFDKSARGSFQGPRARDIFANAVLVGFHGDGSDPHISKASALFRYANVWWNQSGIVVDPTVTFPDASIQYKRAPAVPVFADGDLEIKLYATLASLPFRADSSGGYPLREEVRVEVTAKTPQRLSVIEELLHACQDLLSIACQQYCDRERLIVVEPVADHPDTATFHAVPVFKHHARVRDLHFSDLLFTFTDIKDKADTTFGSWLKNAELLRSIRALYFSAIYSPNFLEGRFLALAQGVEGFHRRCRGGTWMDAAEFETQVVARLVAAIPAGLDPSHRSAIESGLKHGYEYSLRKRLKLLFGEHKTAMDKVVPDAGRFIEPIVTRRNELTHFPPDTKIKPFDAEEWLRYNFVLRLLLEFCFLKTMGFTDDEVARLVERRDEYRRWAERLFRQPEPSPSAG